jgi:hypothetical protein
MFRWIVNVREVREVRKEIDMRLKYPLEYELQPKSIPAGTRWLTVNLKNVGTQTLTGMDVNLNSFDTYSMSVFGTGSYVSVLESGDERLLSFQVSALYSTSLYISIDGWKDGESFHWESPYIPVTVGKEAAELVSLFAMTEPYPALKKKITVEATIRGLTQTEGLDLEFWATTPSGDFEELATVETKALSPDEEVTYSAEITPEEQGMHTIYAYLYDDGRRIARETEYVYAR